MTVIRPNSVSGINSITVQSGNSLAVHKANGELIRTIAGTTGVSTFSSISVGTAYTDNSAGKSINIGLGASIAQHNDNTLTFGTAGDPRITIDASGNFNVGSAATIKAGGNATFSGIVTASAFKGDGSGLSGITQTTINGNTDSRVITATGTANTLQGEEKLTFNGSVLHLNSQSGGLPRIRLQHTGSGNDIFELSSGISGVSNGGFSIKDIDESLDRLIINTSGQIGINTLAFTSGSQFESSSEGAYNIIAKSHNGNGGYHNFTGQAADGTITHYVTHNGQGKFAGGLLIDGGTVQMGSASDNPGTAKVNIVTGGSGINLSRNQGSGANNTEILGAIAFHGGLGSQDITTGGAIVRAIADENQSGSTSATALEFHTKPSGVSPGSAPTKRMELTSGGIIQMLGSGNQKFKFNHSGDVLQLTTEGTNAANHGMIQFRDGAGTHCGQITVHGTNHTTTYSTSSDYRLKQNEVLISDGITRLKQLKPYRFEWKSSSTTVDGFFAHETQTIVPEAILGTKDQVATADDVAVGISTYVGEPIYQGIDQSKLVPLLTAALQEAVTKIETLETKVAALEGG